MLLYCSLPAPKRRTKNLDSTGYYQTPNYRYRAYNLESCSRNRKKEKETGLALFSFFISLQCHCIIYNNINTLLYRYPDTVYSTRH